MPANSKKERPVDAVMNGIRQIIRTLRVYSRGVESRFGVTAAQLFVLECLKEDGPLSVNELATRSFTNQGTVSEVIAKLRQKSLVTPRECKEDRRRTVLELSAKGKKLVAKAPQTPQVHLISAILDLPKKDQLQFAKLMGQVIHGAHFDLSPVAMFFEER